MSDIDAIIAELERLDRGILRRPHREGAYSMTAQSWLRARAERAAREANDGCAHDALCCNCAADAIEAVARDFAERALRKFCEDDNLGAPSGERIAEAIAAAADTEET